MSVSVHTTSTGWSSLWGGSDVRVKLEDEAFDFRVLMAEIERLNEEIAWIDLSFMERDRTPRWAIEERICCHLTGMSLREVSKFLEQYGIKRSHVAIHNCS